MRCTTLSALLVGVMIYVGLGALIFSTLEESQEREAYDKLQKNATLISLFQLVMSAVAEAGLDANSLPANFSTSSSTRWDITSAFFFCGTIITTIGFGNLTPRTWTGQLFCVCYALVGIPMFGILLAGVSDHMGTVLRRAVAKIETLFLKRKVQQTTVRVISAVLSILIGCLIFLAVPTVVFHKVEKWSFIESLYFVVVTLTTVGFGDFVPGKDGIFKLLVLLWIVFGLAYFASILTMIGNWLRVLSKRTRAEVNKLSVTENFTIVAEDGHRYRSKISPSGSLRPLPQYLVPALPSTNAAGCKLLDYFGENLAFIDESSDTLSDRTLPASFEEKKRRPRKPRRKISKRSASHMRKLSHEHVPEKQPTPSPDSSQSESQSDTTTKL
uniref:Potassium channel domain-containing protein n=1 Tax=Periophthalmus magnuspinnatus TaxID=409849 RepID=A0A3B3ZMH6_9GOBI